MLTLDMSNTKTPENELALNNYAAGVGAAIEQATDETAIVSARITMLADVIQIQCIRADDTDLVDFFVPERLHSTIVDLAQAVDAHVSLYESERADELRLEFANQDEQDKIIKYFELLSYQGRRAFPTPDLYQGAEHVDEFTCVNAIGFLHFALKKADEFGWRDVE
jgi:hypothetical protein